jgi:hypothetical protein
MKNKIDDKGDNTKDRYYQEAQSLFIIGTDLEKIKEIVPVSISTLENWQSVGVWERKKELMTEHPKLIGEVLKGLVKKKVKKLFSNEEEINFTSIDEINKILGLIERFEEQSWDQRAAIVEAMSLFGNFARRQMGKKKDLELLAKLMEKFFEEMEGG